MIINNFIHIELVFSPLKSILVNNIVDNYEEFNVL